MGKEITISRLFIELCVCDIAKLKLLGVILCQLIKGELFYCFILGSIYYY